MVACQRLPNGNTFLASLDGYVCELTPEKKELYQFCPIGVKDLHHIRKLRNGDMAAAIGDITPGQNEFLLLDEKGKVKNRCRVGSSTCGAWQSVDELPGGGVLLASLHRQRHA